MKLALSSCWNSHRHTEGLEMVEEIAALGFRYMELSHGIRVSLVPGILQALERGLIQVTTVHNFCPLPPGVMGAAPNLYQPTGSKQEREMWFKQSGRTVEFAASIGAELVVLHSGSVSYMFNSPEVAIDTYVDAHPEADLAHDEAYFALREKALARLQKKAPKRMARLVEGLQALAQLAQEKGVKLGIENREGIEELPLDVDMAGLLDQVGAPETVGYWHDSGHAQIKDRLGLIGHGQLLRENAARQFGWHLHDVSTEGKDHQVPGSGTVDWDMIRRAIEPHHLLTLELSPKLRSPQVAQSKAFIEDLVPAAKAV